MTDLKKRQEEFRRNVFLAICTAKPMMGTDAVFHRESFLVNHGFDAFRQSPEYLAMKEALEFYATDTVVQGTEVYLVDRGMLDTVIDQGQKAREVLAAIESERE